MNKDLTESIDRLDAEEFSYLLHMISKHPNRWRAEVRKAWDEPRDTDPRARRIRNKCADMFHRFNEKNLTAGQVRLAAWLRRIEAGEHAPTR